MRTRYLVACVVVTCVLCGLLAAGALHSERATLSILMMVMGPIVAAGAIVAACSLIEPLPQVQPQSAEFGED